MSLIESKEPNHEAAMTYLRKVRPIEADIIINNLVDKMRTAVVEGNKGLLYDYLDEHPDLDEILTEPIRLAEREATVLIIVREFVEEQLKLEQYKKSELED